jgi:hypothetical protein
MARTPSVPCPPKNRRRWREALVFYVAFAYLVQVNRRTLLALAPLTLLLACSKASPSGPESSDAAIELRALTLDEVSTRIAAHDGKTFVFDNNSRERYASGHLPTARWLDFKSVTAADLPPDKRATLIFYCAGRS